MKHPTTRIARIAVCLMAIALLSLLLVLLPELAREEAASNPAVNHVNWPYFLGAWILSAPIFVALYQSFKLIGYVDRDEALASQSVKALQNIKICAIVFGVLILLAAAATVTAARIAYPQEDTPPIMLVGFVLAFTSSIIATSIAVLQKLLQNAIDLKTENDLTV